MSISVQSGSGEDDFALVYHEEKRQHFFCGKVGQSPALDILTVPIETTVGGSPGTRLDGWGTCYDAEAS